MSALPTFQLPLRPDGPPTDFGWEEREFSALSSTTAFSTGINDRDVFLGIPRCIICGVRQPAALEHCYIIPRAEGLLWSELKERHWLPRQAKGHPEHEPRDGLFMCANHHRSFDRYNFFIRFLPSKRKFIFANYSNSSDFQQFHGKAVGLNILDHHAPFPSLLIIHEMRVREFHPFQDPNVVLPDDDPAWQDWILSDGVLNTSTGFLNRATPITSSDSAVYLGPQQTQHSTNNPGDPSSGRHVLTLNADDINEILQATWKSESWKACQMEGTSWNGTAAENIHKYISTIGTEQPL
ncbi:hypothetical protein ACEPAI_2814 [Sanghuangporus weigelae]